MLVRLPDEFLEVNTPVPMNVWDPKGVLLLRKGENILDAKHLEYMHLHTPMVEEADFKAWNFRYTTELDRMVRDNQSLNKIVGVSRPSVPAKEPSRAAQADLSVAAAWPDIHYTLTNLLHQNLMATDFVTRLLHIEQRIFKLLEYRVDDSLFVLVQMLFNRDINYSATHALLSMVACHLVGPVAGVPEAEQAPLCRAALTMNIGMARLHDALSRHTGDLSYDQNQAVRSHPQVGVNLLRRLGVGDAVWLQLVLEHHEDPSGGGYPTAKASAGVTVQLLRMVDVFVARISPRGSRPGMLPHLAARDIYLNANGQPNPLGAAFVKVMGLYIPGSYVRLANGELAVVVRRGRRANTPLTFAIVRNDMPLGEPSLRDTADRGLEVKASVNADEVRVRLSAERLLSRV